MSNKTFCNFAFRHLYVETNGHQKICCIPMEYIEKTGGYRHHTMKDGLMSGWNSDYMKNARLKMSQGEKVSACKKCYYLESQGLDSLRTKAGTSGEEHFLSQMNRDGSVDKLPNRIELHFGNLCNLKCRMCSHYYSHMWGKELLDIKDKDPVFFKWIQKQGGNVNGWSTGNLSEVYDWFKDKEVLSKTFKEISDHVTEIQAIGGEPTIIAEFWQLFEYLKKENTLSSKELFLVTNGTNINLKIVNYFKEMKKIDIMISLDGLEKRNRYIRFPSDWETILKNLKIYQEICKESPSFNYYIGITPQILNLDHLVDTVLFFQDLGHRVAFNTKVTGPKILDFHYFPDEYKKLCQEKLTKNFDI